MKFPCRKIVGASAIVLMALGSIAPVQLTHAHQVHTAEGNETHTHHNVRGPGHAHDPGHGHVHHEDDRSSADAVSAFGFHTHVYLLGVEIVLPEMPGGDDKQPNDSTDNASKAYLGKVLRHEAVCQSSPHSSILRIEFAVVQHTLTTIGCETKLRRETARFSTPLCDTARHERTGVLVL